MKLEDFRKILKELGIEETEEQALRLIVKAYLMVWLPTRYFYSKEYFEDKKTVTLLQSLGIFSSEYINGRESNLAFVRLSEKGKSLQDLT
jgi:hypothetical protein